MRKAITIVEVLVMVCIIGVLVAILLPAVTAARKIADRGNSKNPSPVVQTLPTKLNLANGQHAIRLKEAAVWQWLQENSESIFVEHSIVTNNYNPYKHDLITDRDFILIYRELKPSVFENKPN